MEVRMERTAGYGGQAEVWVGGQLLTVYDGVSPRGGKVRPGLLENVRFRYTRDEGVDWPIALGDNPGQRKLLEPVRGWSYVGYGQVMAIMPTVIDFGVVQMEDAFWTNDNSLIGKYVRIPVDRLEIVSENT